ncbi:unnamed protein product [Onchocerca flexuosa]|uniref:DUF2946 domain-containing protein n=1 Tax=Onchocerca flexuosa TaxID=387005 RepID=A0A183HX99_9BILA|nr:unnamed protein product [Onchocerca flexuosa]
MAYGRFKRRSAFRWFRRVFGMVLMCLGTLLGSGGDKTDVAATRLTCLTANVVRCMWLPLPSHTDYHIFLPNNPVVNLAHSIDCGSGGAKIQVGVTLYWLRQVFLLV